MIKVIVKTNTMRKEVTAEVGSTVVSVLNELGVDTTGSVTNLNGMTLNATDLCSTFQSLNVNAGDTVRLNSVVKADGGIAA